VTALSNIQAGGRITAAMLQAIAPNAAEKGASQSVTSSATLVNDDALYIALLADAEYRFDLWLLYEGGTQGNSDLKWAWTGPSGYTINYTLNGVGTGGVGTPGFVRGAAGGSVGTNGSTNQLGVLMVGTITTGSTPGTLQLQWAQNTPNATATTVLPGSQLSAWQTQ
jgi:hypothetical protein